MLEMIVKPKKAERDPWEMFFVGLVYSCISLALVGFIFAKDSVLSQYGGILVVVFTVMCCLPFVYYLIKLEEGKDMEINEEGKLVKEHWKALKALMWLFMGLVVGFSFWYITFPEQNHINFNAQIGTFCPINSPHNYQSCLGENGINAITGSATNIQNVLGIFSNNVGVLIVTLIFSLVFGAGAIFILVWNAWVIGAAVGMFAKNQLSSLPFSLLRYMFHGIPEIAAYFIAALAGGIISVAVIRRDMEKERKWSILQDALVLTIIAIIILALSAVLEVYITPRVIGLF